MDIVFGPESVPKDFPVRGGGLLGLRPSQFIAASEDMNALTDVLPMMQQQYPSMTMPVAVLYGRQDRILDYREQGEAIAAAAPNAELELIDGGHMLPVTQPDLTADFIRRQAAL
jgi:pimeloyl-ACP methyl ester carboxylesterase